MSDWVPLDENEVAPSPFVQFDRWFNEGKTLLREPEAIALATATPLGVPSVRMVLMRHHDGTTFGWYTNYDSRKGEELNSNPHAAILWYCEPLGRQIRIEGDVAVMSASASDAYFASRPRGSRLGAHASHQSSPLASRGELEEEVALVGERFGDGDVPRPANWGGFSLTPRYFEFWQHREDRLHDRVVYTRDGDAWRRQRLAP